MKKRLMSLLAAFTFIFIASCDDDHGGNVEAYDTVYAYAAYDADLYQSDAVVWVDNNPGDFACDGPSFVEDDIPVTITSETKPYLPDSFTASKLKITGYTVNYAPNDNSPAMPSKQFYHEWIIEPDSSTDIPVRIISHSDKHDATSPLYYADLCVHSPNDCTHEYTITVIIKAVEMLTGVKHLITVQFPLNYSDYITDDDDCT